jgi:hypothetical protein
LEKAVKRNLKLAMVAVLAVIATLPLAAQNSRIYRDGDAWVEEVTGTMPAATSLRLRTDMGSINVQGGAQKDITYTVRKRVYTGSEESARRDLAAFRVTASKRGDIAVLEGSAERHYRRFSADFQLQVPRDLRDMKAETGGGSINVRQIAGRVDLDSGGGGVQVSDVAGPVSAETGGGAIDVANSSNALNLRTGGGAISIKNSKGKVNATSGGGTISVAGTSDAVSVETGGGTVQVQQCGAELRINTGGGTIEVGDVIGRAMLETGGGNIRLTSAKGPVTANTGGGSIALYKLMQGARAETGAGAITAEFLGMGSDSLLQTSVGDVIVYIGPQAKLTVRATLDMANGHKIRSDFPELVLRSEGGEYGPRNYYLEGNINGGGPVLRVRTMSSNIEVRRAK